MDSRNGRICSSWSRSSTAAVFAASYRFPPKISQPVKTRSLSGASGTKSFTSGERSSVRLPRRIVPICVSEPNGFAYPRRTASTPAINVVATAPMPGIMMPSFPVCGLMLAAPVCAASVFDITRQPFYCCDFSLNRTKQYRVRPKCGATSALTLLRMNTVLPMRPHEPDEAHDEHHLDAQLKAMKDRLELRIIIPAVAQLHADIRQRKAPRP